MRAVYIAEFGSSDNLEIREVPDLPKPLGAQVLVRVRAAGLNRADLLQVRGAYPPPTGYSPNIPGLEFAGKVVAVGEGVKTWTIGDRVFGITAGEAQAEFILTDETLLARIPDGLDFAKAAAVPEAFITAHDAIFTLGNLRHGQHWQAAMEGIRACVAKNEQAMGVKAPSSPRISVGAGVADLRVF